MSPSTVRSLLVTTCCSLSWSPALAAGAAPPAPASEARLITLKYQGTLREALKAIAEKGGLNLVITGDLKDPAEVHLKDVSSEEALRIVSEAHSLKIRRQGSIWTIRPLTAEERADAEAQAAAAREPGEEASAPSPPAPPVAPALASPTPPASPVPPAPPAPPASPAEAEEDVARASKDEIPDPVTDPKGFQRHIEERVRHDVHEKVMRKFRGKRSSRGGKHDLVGTGRLVVEENETVENAVSYGGGLDVKGHVEGDAVAFGGGVHLGPLSEVDGDVVSFGGAITKEDGATVGGEEMAFGGGLGKAVASSIPVVIRSGEGKHKTVRPPSGGSLPSFLVRFAILFGSGFLAMMFAPDRMRLLEAALRREPLRCGIVGLVGVIGLFLLTIPLAVSIIGIPVGLALWVVVAVVCLMGIAALANEIGARLPVRNVRKTQAVVLAMGILLMLLVGLIPVVGGFAWGAIFLLSLGAVIRSRFGTRQLGPTPG